MAFLRDGYARTTVAAIAAAAGVSPDTIFKTFGGKPGLIRAIYALALRGRLATPAEERSEAIQANEHDPRAIVRAWGAFTAELAPRAAPLALLARDAALRDAELEPLVREMEQTRLARMRANAGRLRAAGHLRRGVSLELAAAVMWTCSSPELYELLVIKRGLSLKSYAKFVAQTLEAALI